MTDNRRADVNLEKDDRGTHAITVNKSILDKVYGLFVYARNVTGAKKVYSLFAAKPVQGDADEAWAFYAEGDTKIEGSLDVVGEITKDGISLAPIIFQKKVSLDSAQILALKNTPVEIIPAPGPGKMLIPDGIVLRYRYGTIPYTQPAPSAGAFRIEVSSGMYKQWDAAEFLNTEYDQILVGDGASATSSGSFCNSIDGWENLPILISIAQSSAEYTLGDGSLDVTVFYREITL